MRDWGVSCRFAFSSSHVIIFALPSQPDIHESNLTRVMRVMDRFLLWKKKVKSHRLTHEWLVASDERFCGRACTDALRAVEHHTNDAQSTLKPLTWPHAPFCLSLFAKHI